MISYEEIEELSNEYQEDLQSLREPDFNIDPYWNLELDLHYAQGELK